MTVNSSFRMYQGHVQAARTWPIKIYTSFSLVGLFFKPSISILLKIYIAK